MKRIPVGATISAAYRFAFGGVLSVLGIIWFPYVVLAAVVAGAIFALAPDLPGQIMRGEFDLPLLFGATRIFGIAFLAIFIVRAMVTVGLQQKALGRYQGSPFFYFSLAVPVWRMIGANILAFLVLLLIYVLTALATWAICFAAIKFVPEFGKAIAAVAIIAAVLWAIYVAVRLVFFLPAVVVAEGKVGLERSWELGGGNFWRIVAVLLASFVPVMVGAGIVSHALTQPFMHAPDFAAQFGSHPHLMPDEFGPAYVKLMSMYFQRMRAVLPWLIVLQIIETVVLLGLGNGAIAHAYLGVTSPEGGAPRKKSTA
jgi:hypothetical protein